MFCTFIFITILFAYFLAGNPYILSAYYTILFFACYHIVRPAAPNITVDRVERATGGGSVTIWVSWIQSPNLDQFDIDHYDITVTSTSGVQHMTTECGESTNATLTNVTEVRSNVQLNTIFTVTITATSRCNETSPPANDFYPLRLSKHA